MGSGSQGDATFDLRYHISSQGKLSYFNNTYTNFKITEGASVFLSNAEIENTKKYKT